MLKLSERLKFLGKEAADIRKNFSSHADESGQDGGLSGYRQTGSRNDPKYLNRVAEAMEFFADVQSGRRPAYHMQEAMVTTDFPILYGETLFRQFLGEYENWPVTYPQYFDITEVEDFNKINLITFDGGQGELSEVTEREPYKEFAFTEGKYEMQVKKYGKRYGITFEMVVNRNGQIWRRRPQIMGEAARISEELLATRTMFDIDGPNSAFFTAPNGNIVTGNPALGFTGLQAALQQLNSRKNSDGNPIWIRGAHVIITPADELVMEQIMAADTIDMPTGIANTTMLTKNWLRSKLTWSVNPFIPIVASSATARPWILTAKPFGGRAAFVFAFMTGRRAPQLFMKDGNARQIGGGEVDQWEGDFDHDVMDFKVRHIYGATTQDPFLAVGSDGTGV